MLRFPPNHDHCKVFSDILIILCCKVAPKFAVPQDKPRRNNLEVPVGNSVKLDCSAYGHPRPTVKWYKDGALFKERKGGSTLYLSPWTTVLSLRDLLPTDSGTYTCNVSNPYGWINHTYKVDVHGKGKDVRYLVKCTGTIRPIARQRQSNCLAQTIPLIIGKLR